MPLSTYPNVILGTSGLIAYYQLEGNADDISGNGYHGGAANVTWWHGSALADDRSSAYFNGSNAYVDFGDRFRFPNRDGWTIELWAYPTANLSSGYQGLISKEDLAPSPDAGWSFHIDNASNRWGITRYHTGGYTWVLGANVQYNVWQQLVATYDGTALRIYHNGVHSNGALSEVNATQSAQPTRIGWESGGSWYHGFVDEVSIYNRQLTDTEIANHYNARLVHYHNVLLNVTDNDTIAAASETKTQAAFPVFAASESILASFAFSARTTGLSRTDSRTIGAAEASSLVSGISRNDSGTIISARTVALQAVATFPTIVEHIQRAETLSSTSAYPPLLNDVYEQMIITRAATINKLAARYVDGPFTVVTSHTGIFTDTFPNVALIGTFIIGESLLSTNFGVANTLGQFVLGQSVVTSNPIPANVDQSLPFVVLNADRRPALAGITHVDWDGGIIYVEHTKNVSRFLATLQQYGITIAEQG